MRSSVGRGAGCSMHPAYRGAGRTDSLLDFVEQSAREAGVRRLLFLTGHHITVSVDWFVLHSFEVTCPHQSAPAGWRRQSRMSAGASCRSGQNDWRCPSVEGPADLEAIGWLGAGRVLPSRLGGLHR